MIDRNIAIRAAIVRTDWTTLFVMIPAEIELIFSVMTLSLIRYVRSQSVPGMGT